MARDFDGVDDDIQFGNDASINDFGALSGSCWVELDSTATAQIFITKGSGPNVGWQFRHNATGQIRVVRTYTGTDGTWTTTTAGITTGTRTHAAFTHDGTTADVTIYVNGSTVAATAAPTGSLDADNAQILAIGEQVVNSVLPLNGRLENVCVANATWTAEQVNRARWWGRPGAIAVYHPLYTDKLNNEGTATANGTATGTTVTSFTQITPVVRPGSAMMGLGVGW